MTYIQVIDENIHVHTMVNDKRDEIGFRNLNFTWLNGDDV